jgi:TRAP-type C4-dicarboxylate transport system permease small subunit
MDPKKENSAGIVIERYFSHVSWVVSIFVTLMIVVDVSMRYVFNIPLPASWEMSEVLMPYIVFLPLAYTSTLGLHVKVSILRDRVSGKGQIILDVIANSISFLMCVLLCYYSWLRFWESFLQNETILAVIWIPWWFGKFAMPVGMGLFAIRYFIQLTENFRRL